VEDFKLKGASAPCFCNIGKNMVIILQMFCVKGII